MAEYCLANSFRRSAKYINQIIQTALELAYLQLNQ